MATPKVSPDKGKTIAWYIAEKIGEPWQQALATSIHELILETVPKVNHSIKWGQPVYESPEGPMAFMRGAKKHFTLGFWRGAQMTDPEGEMEGEGDKMKHYKFKDGNLPTEKIKAWLLEAVALNKEFGNPAQRT